MTSDLPFPYDRAATVTIADDAWEDNSCEYPPHSRLYAVLKINGTLFHLDAREVTVDASGNQDFVAYPGDAALLGEALGGDGPYQTLTIAGRDYAVFASPYC
jgi:hypothetical protein